MCCPASERLGALEGRMEDVLTCSSKLGFGDDSFDGTNNFGSGDNKRWWTNLVVLNQGVQR